MPDRGVEQLRSNVVAETERAYLSMTDFGTPGEEWDDETLEHLAAAVTDLIEMRKQFGEESVHDTLEEVRELGHMRAEMLLATLQAAQGDDDA